MGRARGLPGHRARAPALRALCLGHRGARSAERSPAGRSVRTGRSHAPPSARIVGSPRLLRSVCLRRRNPRRIDEGDSRLHVYGDAGSKRGVHQDPRGVCAEAIVIAPGLRVSELLKGFNPRRQVQHRSMSRMASVTATGSNRSSSSLVGVCSWCPAVCASGRSAWPRTPVPPVTSSRIAPAVVPATAAACGILSMICIAMSSSG
jgi:hypothetical protein